MSVPDGREGGYIKAHRQWESSPAVQALTAEGEVVWLRLLFAANWKDSTVILRDGPRIIKRGQALITERTLAERARVGRQVVRTALLSLAVAKCVAIEKVNPRGNPSCNLITILNYDKYQACEELVTQGPTKAQPKPNQRVTRSEEGEEREEVKTLSLEASEPVKKPSRHTAVMALWCRLWTELRGGDPYRVEGGKDGKWVKSLLADPLATDSEIEHRMRRYFSDRVRAREGNLAHFVSRWKNLDMDPLPRGLTPEERKAEQRKRQQEEYDRELASRQKRTEEYLASIETGNGSGHARRPGGPDAEAVIEAGSGSNPLPPSGEPLPAVLRDFVVPGGAARKLQDATGTQLGITGRGTPPALAVLHP